MRYWKRRGAAVYDWGGEGAYKEKYGCQAHRVPWFTKSRFEFISKLRDEAKEMFARKQRVLGWFRTKPGRRGVAVPPDRDHASQEKTTATRVGEPTTDDAGGKE